MDSTSYFIPMPEYSITGSSVRSGGGVCESSIFKNSLSFVEVHEKNESETTAAKKPKK
jgi:hypothetical protein